MPSDPVLTSLAATAVSLGFLGALAYVLNLVFREPRPPRRPAPTPVDDPLAPDFTPRHVLVRYERYCSSCGLTVVDPPHEALMYCAACGKKWDWCTPVAESVPTPE